MHLHGFYFEVDSIGDGFERPPIAPRRSASGRDPSPPAGSDDVDDVDSGAGRQLAVSLSPDASRLDRAAVESIVAGRSGARSGHDASSGMAGMILGVRVLDAAARLPRRRPLPRPFPAG